MDKGKCDTCRYSCSTVSSGEFCEDCLNNYCIYCIGSCNEYKEDTEVSKFIKDNKYKTSSKYYGLLEDNKIRALYDINENIFELKLKDFKTLINILGGGK